MYSQNQEEKFIVDYFKNFKGRLVSIGENDGKTFSNALRLIELGWEAILVEPSKQAFYKLIELHSHNINVNICLLAIGNKDGKATLHESGAHVKNGSDVSLVSSLLKNETTKWKNYGVDFIDQEVNVMTWDSFTKLVGTSNFDFITIDAEGMDIDILKQIDLTETKLLCIEWNSIEENKKQILDYTSKFGMNNIIYQSGENLLIAK